MSYIPTEWKTGDIVTAEKLNKLKEGVASGGGGGGGLLVTVTMNPDEHQGSLDKNYNEISTSVMNGVLPVFLFQMEEGLFVNLPMVSIGFDGEVYMVEVDVDGPYPFRAESPTGTLVYGDK